MASPSYVKWGGCRNPDPTEQHRNDANVDRCALEPADCLYGYDWVSPDLMTAYDHYSCESVETVRLGRCDDSGECAKNKDACRYPNTFQSEAVRDQRCSVKFDETTVTPTRYASCIDGPTSAADFCVVSAAECSQVAHVNKYHDPSCDCSKTHTGACYANINDPNSLYYCAINESACGSGMGFKTAHQAFAAGQDCRLCDSAALPLFEKAPAPAPFMIPGPVTFPANSGSKDSKSKGGIIAGVVLALVAVLIALALLVRYKNKQNTKSNSMEDGTSDGIAKSAPGAEVGGERGATEGDSEVEDSSNNKEIL